MPLDMATRNSVPLQTVAEWDRIRNGQLNPLNLDESVLEKSLELSPPTKFTGGYHLGRYLIPFSCISFDEDAQSRDKQTDTNHVDSIVNRYELMSYALDAQPMMGTLQNGSETQVDGFAGYHRDGACDTFGQKFYIVDIYEFDTPLDRRVARNRSNHHKDVALTQKINDYVKEIVNAAKVGEILKTETAVSDLAWALAEGDKTKKQIEDSIIPKAIQLLGSVYADFRTYSSMTGKKAGKYTLQKFMVNRGYAAQGVQHRTDEQLIAQGYISYCAAEGDNKATWARAIAHGQRLGIPVWVFGYASTRKSDLKDFRDGWIKDFKEMKSIFVDFAFGITDASQGEGVDESVFWCKFAGFLPQHVKPNATKGGRPTEVGLVNEDGKKVVFDPEGKCLTE
tara:strand:- start:79 stop:1263 length:1185 start_codon:yes stop_codon:yes gene_type:complete